MRYYVVTCIVLNISLNIILCNGIGISSKLDFDGAKSSTKLVKTIDNGRHTVLHRNIQINDKTGEDDGDASIICEPNKGCNVTQSNKVDSKDSIETDVVVHVKTKVSTQNNSKNLEDDTPDIPVIIGTSDQSHKTNDDNQYFVGPSITTIDDEKLLTINPSPVFSIDFPYQSHTPSDLDSKVYIQNVSPSTSTINIESLLLDKQEGRSNDDDKYKTNTIEIRVPHFESSYHNHYFGENPPQQVLWYPKTTEFKPRGTVKPQIWSNSDLSSTQHKHVGSAVTCSCNNQVGTRGISTGLQWYPSRRGYNVNHGVQIDDKLAPLN